MLRHFLGFEYGHDRISKAIVSVSSLGWLGVDLFFVLSGFLITDILLRAKGEPDYLKNFYMRRALRILPLYYGALIALFLVIPHFIALSPESVRAKSNQGWLWAHSADFETWAHAKFDLDGGGYYLAHFWSLSVEEHFYLVWPLVVLVANEALLLRVALGTALTAVLIRTVFVLGHVFPGTIYMLTFCRMDGLALGAALAIALRSHSLAAFVRSKAPWVFGASALYAAVVGASARTEAGWHWSMQTFGYSVLDLGAAALIVLAMTNRRFERACSLSMLRAFGKYSYGAYVIHGAALHVLQRRLLPLRSSVHSEALGLCLYALAAIAISMTLAVISFHLFEKPFLKLKRFFEYEAGVPSLQPIALRR